MKGLAIHVEQLIIIIVAVLVLLALITFFLGIWSPGTIVYRAHLTRACTALHNNNCGSEIADVGVDSGVKGDQVGMKDTHTTISVYDVCKQVLGSNVLMTEDKCRKACACLTST